MNASKFDVRVEASGDVDETNSVIGSAARRAGLIDADREPLRRIQHELFEVGAELSLPGYQQDRRPSMCAGSSVDLDGLNAALPPLEEFVLPGGNRAAAVCHVARTVCRRAERRAWAAAQCTTL